MVEDCKQAEVRRPTATVLLFTYGPVRFGSPGPKVARWHEVDTMLDSPANENDFFQAFLDPDERVEYRARAGDAIIALTDRRLAVVEAESLALAVDIKQVRRVEFDIEKLRPATLIIVPESPADTPQTLAVHPEHYDEVAAVLVTLGRRIAGG